MYDCEVRAGLSTTVEFALGGMQLHSPPLFFVPILSRFVGASLLIDKDRLLDR